jgi:hypothetical protein
MYVLALSFNKSTGTVVNTAVFIRTFRETSSIITLLSAAWVQNLIPHFEEKIEFESI